MALAHCTLSKFLGVGCHCFPPPLDAPPSPPGSFTSNDARDLQQRKVELFVDEKCSDKFRLEFDFHVILGIFYMLQICDMGQAALLPLQRKACWGFFICNNPVLLEWWNNRRWDFVAARVDLYVCVSYLKKILNAFSILVGKINGQIP
jgi:hypothetical protein